MVKPRRVQREKRIQELGEQLQTRLADYRRFAESHPDFATLYEQHIDALLDSMDSEIAALLPKAERAAFLRRQRRLKGGA